ncbi:hypothetical protein Slala03_51260 [Streptomyces lavendulae subsp. lavendulae]|nr:hypothetical protein Slala03_51260 [Streptomyces lavendulae subsp. lavendulae]
MTDPQNALQGILPGWSAPPLPARPGPRHDRRQRPHGLQRRAGPPGRRPARPPLRQRPLRRRRRADPVRTVRVQPLDTVSNALQLIVVLIGPLTAVYATDIALRRGRYDGIALCDETAHSPYRYTAGVNPAGALALCAGVGAAALCVDTLYSGPVAALLGGLDLSLPLGMAVSATLYAVTMRNSPTVRAARALAPTA